MKLNLTPYSEQKHCLPPEGKVVLAQYDDESIVVYQAYRPEIGLFAAKHNYFGGEFKLSRMSWIKPNFLWMMYRSGWGTKEGQEITLAVRIKREAFDFILSQAVHAKYSRQYGSQQEWQKAVARSNVRLQWDPDRTPRGGRLQRRAIQLGLRKDILTCYSQEWIIEVEDISHFVSQQRQHLDKSDYGDLQVPIERVYPVENPATASNLGITN